MSGFYLAMNETITSSKPTSSSRGSQRNHSHYSSNALVRKRQRDKENQQRKRERERKYIADLEAKVCHLERMLEGVSVHQSRSTIATPYPLPPAIVPSLASNAYCNAQDELENSVTLASHSTTGNTTSAIALHATVNRQDSGPQHPRVSTLLVSPPATNASSSSPSCTPEDNIVVSLGALSRLLETPEWGRVPLWNLTRQGLNYQFFDRGQAFKPLIAQLRADPAMEAACPPYPKTLDLFFGGSRNLLANFVHSEISGTPLLPLEKYSSMYLLYLYLRACVLYSPLFLRLLLLSTMSIPDGPIVASMALTRKLCTLSGTLPPNNPPTRPRASPGHRHFSMAADAR